MTPYKWKTNFLIFSRLIFEQNCLKFNKNFYPSLVIFLMDKNTKICYNHNRERGKKSPLKSTIKE